ncbi:putative transmembrane sensor protein [Azoarcus sp. CIB]|uniref:LCCL domain-containing protein n=1 Tax=Aromatoleum sp. (strain CIB) TaxID=198107 RepID=UPI00067B0BE8|nr:LCCL domain-containing protein [Azoarcus sp. CIB]AKU14089.1 putative transmembrane sensor protein [Azoarcus sp. CIB]
MTPAPTAFISHAADDATTAAELCRHLESRGIRCWIAPRDVTPGREYAAEILSGIESCNAFVLLLSGHSNESLFVHREVERATSKGKAIFPVRIENVLPDRELELFISSAHWIDAWEQPQSDQWERLAQAIRGVRPTSTPAGLRHHTPPAGASRARHLRLAAGIGIVVVAILAGSWIMRGERAPDAPPADSGPRPAAPAGPSEGRVTPDRVAPVVPDEALRTDSPQPAPEQPAARSAGAPEAVAPCPQTIASGPKRPTPVTCDCSADNIGAGTVWGSDLYTTDSNLCDAAVHAGAITRSGGTVTVERRPGRLLYVGSSRNGVVSHDYGAFGTSMHFAGTPLPAEPGPCPARLSVNLNLPTPFTCTCSADRVDDGTVWGSNLYTTDSSLCQAVVHAGAIARSGGTVTVERRPGRLLYVGTPRNGVVSHDYGTFGTSMRFAGTPDPAEPGPCPGRLSINANLPTPFTCVCSADRVTDGTVWGTDLYTADSSLCRAALHAGAIARSGGTVTVDYQPGLEAYAGTRRNGVASHDYGTYPSSIRFR